MATIIFQIPFEMNSYFCPLPLAILLFIIYFIIFKKYFYISNIRNIDPAIHVIPINRVSVNLKGSSFCVALNEKAASASNPASLLLI